jgi:hypothetical protein
MLFVASDVLVPTRRFSRYASHTTPLASDLGLAFAEACGSDTPSAMQNLQRATTRFVSRLKANGIPPERVIVAINEALTRDGGAKLPPSFDDAEGVAGEKRSMAYRHVFGWCLDAYYGDSCAIRNALT